MAFNPVTNGIRCQTMGSLADGHSWSNVLWFSGTSTLDQSAADAISDLISDAYSNLITHWYTSTSIDHVVITDERTLGAPQFISTSSFPLVGTLTDNPLPAQVCALVSWVTAFRGK